MKDLVLDGTLQIGIDEIDDDHRKLVDLFNILNHSLTEGATTDYIESVLEELINCTVWHFSHEERLMLKYGYDRYLEHKTEHRDLIESAKALQQKFIQTGKLDEGEDIEFLERWLTEHILVADLRLGTFLIDAM
ncbi:MAG: bacteriohemerythrin [Gammaproteobacteria bacterium]|nr:bacteriohemerythrin [Gammaproteobacteria bacterium]MBT8134957.1 bacteriohemerythrin [Gammaproteobacteria bacterium]NNJ51049.1 hemerythrin family protein [Gammaproteobacteria bacterium]